MSTLDYAEIYKDDHGEWRYRIKASNHEIIAEGESYKNRQDMVDVLALHFPTAAINLRDLTQEDR